MLSIYHHTNSLLEKLCTTSGIPDGFSLDSKSVDNPPKHSKLSLSRGKKSSPTTALEESINQPAKPVTSPKCEKAAKGVIPVNTEHSANGRTPVYIKSCILMDDNNEDNINC